jgi:hypothetical protein
MTCGAIFELPHLAHSEDIGGKIIGEMFVASLLLGVAALLFIALEFQLISMTSALSFSVMGTFKEVLQITLAFLILHNRLTVVKALGIAVVLIAVAAYHRIQLQLHSQQPSPPASELGSLADTNDGKSGHVSGSGYVRRDIHNPNGKPDATYKPVRALETELEVAPTIPLP